MERVSLPAAERNALLHAVEKWEAFGPQLGFPHSSARSTSASVTCSSSLRSVRRRRWITGGSTRRPGWQGIDWRSWRRTEVTRLSQLRTADDIRREDLADGQVHAEYIRTALARAVAMRVLAYRTERGMSQTALARELGMQQPAVARLEAGEHEPTFSTLERLARGLGIEFHIDITPSSSGLRDTAWPQRERNDGRPWLGSS